MFDFMRIGNVPERFPVTGNVAVGPGSPRMPSPIDAPAGRRERVLAAGVALAAFVFFGAWDLRQYRPLTWLVGDGPYYAETAVSLLQDHDLDLRNQLPGGLGVHGPQIALGPGGEWFPKHPILLPVVGLPFLAACGVPGLLILNLVVLAGFAALLFTIGCRVAPPGAAAAATAFLLLGTFVRAYAYNLSPDLFASLLVAAGVLAAIEARDAAAGLLLGAAVLAKPLLAALLAPALAYVALRRGARPLARFVAGGLLPACGFLLLNLALFGSPFVTAYDRNVAIVDGTVRITTHRDQFDGNPLVGARGMLIDPRHGLLRTAPALLVALPGFLLLRRRRPAEAAWLASSALLLFLVLCPYRFWAESHYGNRFLMPLVVFAAPGLALIFERLFRARRSEPAARVLDAAA